MITAQAPRAIARLPTGSTIVEADASIAVGP